MAIQEMLELELLVALVTNVDATILFMQMIVQEDSAKRNNQSISAKPNQVKLLSLAGEDISAFVAIEPAHFPVMQIVMLH